MFRYADPWVFWVLLLVPLWGVWWLACRSRAAGVMLSVFGRAAAAEGAWSWRALAGLLAPLARAGALAALVVALARPQEMIPRAEATRDAVALQLVVDRSGSMSEAVLLDGERMTRLDAVKRVVHQFVAGDGRHYRGREGDLVGLIAFGTYADTLSPLTASHGALLDALARLEIPVDRRERATAIGDGLVLACARLQAAEDAMRADIGDPDFAFRSKAVILLTDGENNAGVYSPADGASLAREWGIRVYIINIRDDSYTGGISGRVFGGARRGTVPAYEREMRAVAEHTGGRFWGVDDPAGMAEVYSQIDELERTEILVTETTEIVDLYHRYAVLAVLLLGIEFLLRGVAGGRLP